MQLRVFIALVSASSVPVRPPVDRAHACLPICSQLDAFQLKDHLRRRGDATGWVPQLLAVHPQVTAVHRMGDSCCLPLPLEVARSHPFPGPHSSCWNTEQHRPLPEATPSSGLAQARPGRRVPYFQAPWCRPHPDGRCLLPRVKHGTQCPDCSRGRGAATPRGAS